jgi:hypothetical protein
LQFVHRATKQTIEFIVVEQNAWRRCSGQYLSYDVREPASLLVLPNVDQGNEDPASELISAAEPVVTLAGHVARRRP